MAITVIGFIAAAFLSPALGFGPIVLIVLSWMALLITRAASGQGLALVPMLWRFLLVFGAVVLAESPTWGGAYRVSNLLGTITFVVAIPSIVVSLAVGQPGALRYMERGVIVSFWAFSVTTLVYGLGAGIDLQRNVIFIPDMQKNGVGTIYEMLFLYVFASARRNVLMQLAALLTGIPALLIIGSKTALALSFLFALGLWARWLFVVGAPAAFGGVIWEALKFDYESTLRTAAFRLLTWRQAWQEIDASPQTLLFGNGPATFMSRLPFSETTTTGAHNIVLQFWHDYGLVGLVVVALLFGWVWRRFGMLTIPGIACFWLFNFHALFDVGWVNGPGFVAGLVLGLGMAAAYQAQPVMVLRADRRPAEGLAPTAVTS
jgi:O-antigen ligase